MPSIDRTRRLIPLSANHAPQVATLHIQAISTGFISSLGSAFVTALYESIAAAPTSFGFVVIENDKLVGFAAFTSNLSALYKSVLYKHGVRFAFLLAAKLISARRIKSLFETLLYPKKTTQGGGPAAEILAICVRPENRGQGLAEQLIRKGLERYRQMGIDNAKVLVAAENAPANKLYQKCGFHLHSQIDSHGVKSNLYIASTAFSS